MTITIPLVAADGAKSTTTVPNPVVASKNRRERVVIFKNQPAARYAFKPVGSLPTPKTLQAATGKFALTREPVAFKRRVAFTMHIAPAAFAVTAKPATISTSRQKALRLSIAAGVYALKYETTSLKAHGVTR